MDNRLIDCIRELKSDIYDSNFEVVELVDVEIRLVRDKNEHLMRTLVTFDQR